MSEQRPEVPPQQEQLPLTPAPEEAAAGSPPLFPPGVPEPSDNTPTIISRTPPQPAIGALHGILRGRKLAHFELIEPIGIGGMAAVLRARDTQLDRDVALKILPPEMAADPENVRRFHQEARAAARLDHETIARVFYCGEDQGLHFIAFEFVEGENLRTHLERRGALPVEEALPCMLQVATGLAHAAERGVVHRDIKPSNIIISPNGRAKLVDMGLARSLGVQSDKGLTQSGVTLGTFDYISPEQALEPRDADVRSDIYSLGCTFYHVLTGQAPVPEGTAARKLHHHQHVLPIDPRQINPEIPDDVAAILARMMAKDPGQRYQRPEHLVHHLLQVMQKLGAAPEGPENVLFVDAPLPSPPQSRPLLLGGLAALIVVVIVFFINPVPRPSLNQAAPPQLGHGASPPGDNGKDGPGSAGPGLVDTSPGPERPPPLDAALEVEVASFEQLARFVQTAPLDRPMVITLSGDLHLPPETETVVRGRTIILQSKDRTATGRRPTVWATYRGQAPSWNGLVLNATERIELRGVRVVADANEHARKIAALQLRSARDMLVVDCEFLQGNWLPSSSLTALALHGSGSSPPRVFLRRSAFLGGAGLDSAGPMAGLPSVRLSDVDQGGQDAVLVSGTPTISVEGCAFGPHHALFRLEKGARVASIEFTECTALAGDDWAAVQLDEQASCDLLKATACLFARVGAVPDRALLLDQRAVASLLRHTPDSSNVTTTYKGQQNRYLNLDAVRARADETGANLTPDTFANQLRQEATKDDRVLTADFPLGKDKDRLALLQGDRALDSKNLLAAFKLPDQAPELRYGERLARIVGMQDSPWGRLYDSLPPPDTAKPTAVSRPKIVDPSEKKTDTVRGVYVSLGAALAEAEPGDVILLRHTGVLKVSPTTLLKPGLLTLRADADRHPVLVLDDTRDRDASLFHVHDGQLVLEGVEVRLRPQQDGFDSQSVATLHGDGAVLFKSCVVTLDGRRAPLAAVALADPKDVMPQPVSREGTGPRVAFDSCFIRGEGDLVWARASRPFELDVQKSLVALTGSLLNVENLRENGPDAVPTHRLPVSLSRVTAYLGGHLVRLRSADLKSLVPVIVDPAQACLFVSADGSKALIHLEGTMATDDQVREKVVWKGDQNRYSNFLNMLDQQPSTMEMRMDAVTREKWTDFASDLGSKFVSVTFAGPLWPKARAAELTPDSFRADGLPDVGAMIERLPAPAAESKGS
jgi:serine/threonine protein kinase